MQGRTNAPSPSTRRKQGCGKAFLLDEIIGKKVRVVKSSCRDVQGIEGVVVEETLGTFLLGTARGEKRVLKKGNYFLFLDEAVVVDGRILLCRPEDRTKKLFRKFGA